MKEKKLKSEPLATRIIDLIDDQVFFFFFQKPKNLSQLNWCAKYMLYSDFIHFRNVQSIQFYWFKIFSDINFVLALFALVIKRN